MPKTWQNVQPVQLADGQWYIPGKETVIGFGDAVVKEYSAQAMAVSGKPELLFDKGRVTPMDWLNRQVDEVCALAR